MARTEQHVWDSRRGSAHFGDHLEGPQGLPCRTCSTENNTSSSRLAGMTCRVSWSRWRYHRTEKGEF